MLHLISLNLFFIVLFHVMSSVVSKEYNVVIRNKSIVIEIMCKRSWGWGGGSLPI